MADPSDVTPTGRRFGARLRALMESREVGESGRPMTVDGLYREIEDVPGLAMSRGHLYRLCDGKAIPRLDVIEALARFFNVRTSYFVDDSTYTEGTLDTINDVAAKADVLMDALKQMKAELLRDIEQQRPPSGDTSDSPASSA